MPLAAKQHGRAPIDAYLWGLLPDNEQVLARWATKFQVSARNVFALISHVGEDCAGAVQIVTPDRLDAIINGKEDKVEWLDEADIAKRMQSLREDHAAWRLPRDTRCAMNRRRAITEIGCDSAALRREDRDAVLFDLGLCCLQVDVCIRTPTRICSANCRGWRGEDC